MTVVMYHEGIFVSSRALNILAKCPFTYQPCIAYWIGFRMTSETISEYEVTCPTPTLKLRLL